MHFACCIIAANQTETNQNRYFFIFMLVIFCELTYFILTSGLPPAVMDTVFFLGLQNLKIIYNKRGKKFHSYKGHRKQTYSH